MRAPRTPRLLSVCDILRDHSAFGTERNRGRTVEMHGCKPPRRPSIIRPAARRRVACPIHPGGLPASPLQVIPEFKEPMSESDVAKYLDTFPNWLRNLGHDAEELSELLTESTVAQDAREAVAGGLNYLFKSLDLIPDGIDDIGYLDDAFVLRVAADLASAQRLGLCLF